MLKYKTAPRRASQASRHARGSSQAQVSTIRGALRPTAWHITCAARDCAARSTTRLHSELNVTGDHAAAGRTLYAAGWRPCYEVLPELPVSAHWYCPACTARLGGRSRG